MNEVLEFSEKKFSNAQDDSALRYIMRDVLYKT